MSHSNLSIILTSDLTSVTGGQGVNYNRSPEKVVQQVNRRIETCRALGAEAKRLNPYRNRLSGTLESGIFQSQADQCWKSLRGE